MVETSDPITTAFEFISEATKGANSLSALFTGLTGVNSSIKDYLVSFKRQKSDILKDTDIQGLSDKQEISLFEVSNLGGTLSPIMGFKAEEEFDYKKVSEKIKQDVNSSFLSNPDSEFVTINSREWLTYGCSLQSTTNTNTQILSLVDTEEANAIPIITSNKYFKNELSFEELNFGINAQVTGISVPINDKSLLRVLSEGSLHLLKESGYNKVVVPDEAIINQMGVDFSSVPGVYVNKQKSFFLGYLWCMYINIRTREIIPIYEYGNLGEKNSFILLSEKLIHQIEFFKKRIWNDLNREVDERNYHLLMAYNDNLNERITHYFNEKDTLLPREELLSTCRDDLLKQLFS